MDSPLHHLRDQLARVDDLEDELASEREESRRLREENDQLREELAESSGISLAKYEALHADYCEATDLLEETKTCADGLRVGCLEHQAFARVLHLFCARCMRSAVVSGRRRGQRVSLGATVHLRLFAGPLTFPLLSCSAGVG